MTIKQLIKVDLAQFTDYGAAGFCAGCARAADAALVAQGEPL
jgi:hypothetical protein